MNESAVLAHLRACVTTRARRAALAAAGVARATGVVLALLALAVVGTARAAERHAGERFAAFGDGLLALTGMRAHSEPRRLGVNGLELGVVTLSTELDVTSTLDRLEAVCTEGGIEAPRALLGRDPDGSLLRALERVTRGILRQESEQRGVVGCIDTGERLAPATLSERLGALERTGDLAELGELRFVFARRTNGVTTALVLYSSGRLPLLRALPKVGDAPGHDLDGVPRPESSRRLLSAAELGAPYGVAVFEVKAGSDDALASYLARLEHAGFAVTPLAPKGTVLLRKGERALLVRLMTAEDGRRVFSIARLS